MNTEPEQRQPSPRAFSPTATLVSLVVLGLGLAVVVWGQMTTDLVGGHVFWVLAALPGTVAVVSFWLTVPSRFTLRQAEVRTIQMVQMSPAQRSRSAPLKDIAGGPALAPAFAAESAPRFEGTLFGAACLTAVYVVVAILSGTNYGLGVGDATPPASEGARRAGEKAPQAGAAKAAAAEARPVPAVPATAGAPNPAGEPSKPAPSTDRPNESRIPAPNEGRRGLVYAAYGAYIYMVRLFVSRLNNSTLTPRFLIRMAFNGAVAIVLGYVAGELGTFRVIASENQSLFFYFSLGLFPDWAANALRNKARDLFQPPETGCESLPLCLVDGLDGDVADRLSEIGIWDIQHLACSNPADLVLRSLFPTNRVVDWIDQAILITYVRGQIATFRQLGVRSAIELALLYGDYVEDPADDPQAKERQARARSTLDGLAQKAGMPKDTILIVGRYLFEDANVDVIWRLWQRAGLSS